MFVAVLLAILSAQLCCAQSLRHLPIVVASDESTPSAAIDLPSGFKPQRPPLNPLLYPLRQNVPNAQFNDDSSMAKSDWIPIHVDHSKYAAKHLIPMAVDRLYVESGSESNEFGERQTDSIVYGSWKAQHPQKPADQKARQTLSSKKRSSLRERLRAEIVTMTGTTAHLNPSPQRRNQYGVELGRGKKIGRQKMSTRPVSVSSTTAPPTTKTIEFINVPASDPQLVAVATQINHSLETTKAPTFKRKRTTTTTSTTTTTPWSPIPTTQQPKRASQQATQTHNSAETWPSHFLPTTIKETAPTETTPSMERTTEFIPNYAGDSAEPPFTFNSLNIPESLLPQLPKNITRLGVPYETYTSQEAQLCVPFTVREPSLPNDSSEFMDVERVYCFPLPTANGVDEQLQATINNNNNLSINHADTSFEYEIRNAGKALKASGIVSLMFWTAVLQTIHCILCS